QPHHLQQRRGTPARARAAHHPESPLLHYSGDIVAITVAADQRRQAVMSVIIGAGEQPSVPEHVDSRPAAADPGIVVLHPGALEARRAHQGGQQGATEPRHDPYAPRRARLLTPLRQPCHLPSSAAASSATRRAAPSPPSLARTRRNPSTIR